MIYAIMFFVVLAAACIIFGLVGFEPSIDDYSGPLVLAIGAGAGSIALILTAIKWIISDPNSIMAWAFAFIVVGLPSFIIYAIWHDNQQL